MRSRAGFYMKQFGLVREQLMSSPNDIIWKSPPTPVTGYNLEISEENGGKQELFPLTETLSWGLTSGVRKVEDNEEFTSFEKKITNAGHYFLFKTVLTKNIESLYTMWTMDGRTKKLEGAGRGTMQDSRLFFWAINEWLDVLYTTLTYVGSDVRMVSYSGDTDDKPRLQIFERIAQWITAQVQGKYMTHQGPEQTLFGIGADYSHFERQ